MLETFNRIGSFPENRLYMRLKLKTHGLAVNKVEMPELPSFHRRILTESERSDIQAYSDTLVVQHKVDFAVDGERSFKIRISRRADQ